MEFICSVRLCKVVSVLCNVTMDAYSLRHQCPGCHAGIYMCRMYEAVFQIILHWQVGQAVPIVGAS